MNAIARVADYPRTALANKIVDTPKDISSNFYRPSKLIPVFPFSSVFSSSTSNPPRATRALSDGTVFKFAETSRARFTARGMFSAWNFISTDTHHPVSKHATFFVLFEIQHGKSLHCFSLSNWILVLIVITPQTFWIRLISHALQVAIGERESLPHRVIVATRESYAKRSHPRASPDDFTVYRAALHSVHNGADALPARLSL